MLLVGCNLRSDALEGWLGPEKRRRRRGAGFKQLGDCRAKGVTS
jgi:hypothetical protein